MNRKNVSIFLGNLLMYVGLAMLFPLGIALYFSDGDAQAFAISAAISIVGGLLLRGRGKIKELSSRDAFAIVTLGWASVALMGALPFFLSGVVPTFVDGLFEATSGVTTTGASLIVDIESAPHGVMLWRSLLQWLGGMGFIVLSIAVLPKFAIGGMALFKAEVPTPLPERITPRLRETSLVLWRIYIGLTGLLIFLLWVAGMNVFEAVLHGLATMPTGGFGTRATSVAAFDSLGIELVLSFFMLLAGANFTLYYRAIQGRSLREITRDPEFRVYLGIISIATILVTWNLWAMDTYSPLTGLRHASFQVVSVITTTGFASDNFNDWPALSSAVLLLLMFVGGSAGSTAGGVKVLRHMVVAKHGYRELLRLIHPRAVRPVRIGIQTISESVIAGVLSFVLLYVALFGVGTLLIAAHDVDLRTAVTAVASAIGNVGPGLGRVGPMANYAFLAPSAKIILSVLMLIGRLEIYTVLVLLLPRAWAQHRPKPRDN